LVSQEGFCSMELEQTKTWRKLAQHNKPKNNIYLTINKVVYTLQSYSLQ
jgi:hypothetical protein